MNEQKPHTYTIASAIYLIILFALMWLPINGLQLSMNNFLWGIRIDHLYHATIFIPCVLMLMPLCRFHRWRAWIVGLLITITTESVQGFLPYRNFDINDLIANILGVSFGVLLTLIPRYRKWVK